MIARKGWQNCIESAWQERSIVWLCGPRRLGKTTLAASLKGVRVFDCDVPRIRRDVEEWEIFLKAHQGERIVVLATGSSTLGASARFRDTLAGRKRTVRLSPVLASEMEDFGIPMSRRLLQGGLPENLIAEILPERDYREWIEAYWARDILELFSVGKRYSFLKFLELLWVQSGGLCELTSFTAACEASRQTLANYLDIFESTGVVHVLRPYATNPSREIVALAEAG